MKSFVNLSRVFLLFKKMYLVLELEPEEVTIDDFFHIEVAYSWVSEAS